MRKRTAGGKSTTLWRLSFWRFSIGFRIITALFHKKKGLVKASPFFDFIRSYGTNEISSMLELVFSDKTEFSSPARQDFAISTYMRKTEAL